MENEMGMSDKTINVINYFIYWGKGKTFYLVKKWFTSLKLLFKDFDKEKEEYLRRKAENPDYNGQLFSRNIIWIKSIKVWYVAFEYILLLKESILTLGTTK